VVGVRADAERNRARILEVAFDAFAAEGLSVPVHEIARRAGVGTGTVSRHFPTKEALFEATCVHRAAQVLEHGRALAAEHPGDPGTAFFAFFSLLVTELAADRGLVDALAGAGIDLEAATADAGHEVIAELGALLERAQEAGAVRRDVHATDVKALMMGCLADGSEPPGEALARRIDVIRAGLRAS
jgi:AcrR family transcriptional regulator